MDIEEGLHRADRDSGQHDGIGQSDRRVKLGSKLHDASRAAELLDGDDRASANVAFLGLPKILVPCISLKMRGRK